MGLEDIAGRRLGRFVVKEGALVPSDSEEDLERLMEPRGPRDLGKVWCKAVGKATGQMCRPLTVAHEGMLKQMAKATGGGKADYPRTAAILVTVVFDWEAFVARCKREAAAFREPTRPLIPFLNLYWQQALNHTQEAQQGPKEGAGEARQGTTWRPGQLSQEEREKLLQEALEE